MFLTRKTRKIIPPHTSTIETMQRQKLNKHLSGGVIFLAVGLITLCATASPLRAQQPTRPSAAAQDSIRKLTQQLTPAQQEVLKRIHESGLSREQMRDRLRAAGYDPMLADRYYDVLAEDTTAAGATRSSTRLTRPLPRATGNFVEALRRIGILAVGDTLPSDRITRDSLVQRRRAEQPTVTEPQVFGRELFAATTQFEAITAGPVDPDYRFGPGDEITLLVTGDVEAAYDLQVTREGYVVVPDVGQVLVNGLTLAQLRARLNERLGRVYSGVQAGTTEVDLAVGRLRSKLVYVIGEVEVPGTFQVPGSASVFSALFRAGGPAEHGSFRRIEVRRDNRVIRVVDLYDYLLKGDKGDDIRLEQGDVVFVPVVGHQVTVVGSVRRQAIFELIGNESLIDVLTFAGGVQAEAALERIQIDRILAPGQRQPGRERALIDVPLEHLRRSRAIALQDGDRVRVSSISDARRNRVAVTGDVQRPGDYEYRRGMTAGDLIAAAQGLLPTAYTPAAHIIRLNPADSSTSLVHITLTDTNAPDHASRIALEDTDELVVFSRARLANPRTIEILGHVKEPGSFTFSDDMTIQDLVLLAGGFQEGAAPGQAEVARRLTNGGLADSLATVYRVPIDLSLTPTNGRAIAGEQFGLQPGDQVFIRRLPGFEPLSTVEITGEVIYPGPYTVGSRTERVSDIIKRAGGLTPEGFAKGFRLFRDGIPIGVDLPRALKKPNGPDDLILEPGDRMVVPRVDPTVFVTGAVMFESRIRYDKDLSLKDYVSRAGGVTDSARVNRAAVRYPNGELRTSKKILWFRTYPEVQPGSTITIPTGSGGYDWGTVISRAMTVLSTLATVALTVNALK
jgi:polysaccharide biosynthesis/export protein